MQINISIYFLLLFASLGFAQPITYTDTIVDAGCGGSATGFAQINVTSTNAPYTYLWSNGDTDNTLQNVVPGTYSCTIQDNSSNSITVSVIINEQECVFTPELYFTPNGDGYNDTWHIGGIKDVPEPRVVVYNRMGQKVYESKKGIYESWDGRDFLGTPVPDATYFYIIFSSTKSDKAAAKGSVSILR